MQKRLDALNPREVALMAIVLVLGIFAYFKYYYGPAGTKLAELDRQISEAQAQITRDSAIAAELQARTVASVRKAESDSSLKPFLDSSKRFAQVIQNLAADSQGVVTKGVTLDKAGRENELKELSLTIELEGAYPAIGAFVERLESSSMIAAIESIDLSRDHMDLTKCFAKIKIKSYLIEEATR